MQVTGGKKKDFASARLRGVPGVVLVFLTWVIFLLSFSFFTYVLAQAYKLGPGHISAGEFFRSLIRYDAAYYLDIARHGYAASLPLGGREIYVSTAFWPLYPLLIRTFATLTAGNHIAASLAAAWLSLLLALVYLYKLARLSSDDETSLRSCLFALLFPTACFLFFPYAEPVFLLCAVASLYHARRSSWILSGMWGFLACLARPVGLAVCVALVVEALQQSGWKPARLRPRMAAVLVAPLGLVSYLVYLRWRFGDFFYFATAHREGWRTGFNPWSLFSAVKHLFAPERLSEFVRYAYLLFFFLLFAVLLVPAFRKLRLSLAVYGTLCLLISAFFTSSDLPLQSMNRHVIVIFPAFLILGSWGGNRDFERFYIFAGTLGLATFTAVYLLNFFSG
ncbi:MAG: hypothetical protein H5T73_01030 [Actinobacteria bacterium]|nr:hypothetical protein [Actinomycetota bacterium]